MYLVSSIIGITFFTLKIEGGHHDHDRIVVVHWMVGPLQTLGFLFRYGIQNGGYGKNVSKRFFSSTTWTIETKGKSCLFQQHFYRIFSTPLCQI